MSDLDSFMSYELTHDKKNGNNQNPNNSGCLSGCFVLVFAVLIIIAILIFI